MARSLGRAPRALLVGCFLVAAVMMYWLILLCPLPLVAAWWNTDAERATTFHARHRIGDRLATSGQLNGMTRSEVVALLGPPTETDKFRNHGLVYVLGPERGFISIDYEWLLVDFDASGKAAKVSVTSD